MADFYRVNGNAGVVGVAQSFVGKAPKFFGLYICNNGGSAQDISAEMGVKGAVKDILNNIESNASVLVYQVENASSGNISLMLEGVAGATTATTLQAQIRGGGNGSGWYGNTNNIDARGTLVFDAGFKLALS